MTAKWNKNPVPFYLMSCYLYYECDESVMSDDEFDELSRFILDNWKTIKHPHKRRIKKSDLEAGTGYAIKYTNMIRGAAHQWLKESRDAKVC